MRKTILLLLSCLLLFSLCACNTQLDVLAEPEIVTEEIELTVQNFKTFFDIEIDPMNIEVITTESMVLLGIYVPARYEGKAKVKIKITPKRDFNIINVKNVKLKIHPKSTYVVWENDYCKWDASTNTVDMSKSRPLTIDIPSTGEKEIYVDYYTNKNAVFINDTDRKLVNFTPNYILRDIFGTVVVEYTVYMDSENKSDYQSLKNLEIGDSFNFGSFEQDGLSLNGTESIEWIALAKENGKILALSKECLYAMPFHILAEDDAPISWEKSDLRSWLNTEFYDAAFNDKDKKYITSTTISNKNSSAAGGYGEGSTTDNVFCLSIDEVKQYLSSDEAIATTYAEMMGASVYNGHSSWWLRSIVESEQREFIAAMYGDGSVGTETPYELFSQCIRPAEVTFVAVRPVIWLDTN